MCAITIQMSSFLTVASLSVLLLLTNPAYLPISALAVASSKIGGAALSTIPIIHNNEGPVIQEIAKNT
jgi:hypothetical protein